MLRLACLLLPQVMETEPVMPAEDFSFFTQAVPSTFMFLGIRNEALDAVHNLHNRNFKIDEDALQYGAALHATIAQRYLQRSQDGFGAAAAAAGSSSRDEL
jgi:IAA-amino acid hydrolase